MKGFVVLSILPVTLGAGSLFSTLTGGATLGGIVLGMLTIFGVLVLIRYLSILCFSGWLMKSKFVESIFFNLQEITGNQWNEQSGPIFICGQFEGQHKRREAIFKVIEHHPGCPGGMEAYLLLKPNTLQTQNLLAPSMYFPFGLKRCPKPIQNTYTKAGWLIYKPKLSYGQSAWDFYKDKQNLTQALDELTRAAEIIEAKPSVEDSPKPDKKSNQKVHPRGGGKSG